MIAIHHRPNSFSDRWIQYLNAHNLPYRIIDIYDKDELAKLEDIKAVLWHWDQVDPVAAMIARSITLALEQRGIVVFPSHQTSWHYDDKVAQQYLLDQLGAPAIPWSVFWSKDKAVVWAKSAQYPKVFKLRRGAGSLNVVLVRSESQALKLINKAFGSGFKPFSRHINDFSVKKTRFLKTTGFSEKLKKLKTFIIKTYLTNKYMQREKGYFYIQEFLPGNSHDTRVTVIGDRAFCFTRNNRPNDFRASGSGSIDYDQSRIEKKCIEIAFSVARKLGSQSMAFDFLIDSAGSPRIVEISYCYQNDAVFNCPGYWDVDLSFHSGNFWPEDMILEDVLSAVGEVR